MALQYSVTVRNAKLDSIVTTTGASPLLRIYTGSVPGTCATAASGTLLVEMTLPSTWMGAAGNGAKSMSGTWQDSSANATGTAGYWRIYKSDGTTCTMQGTVTATGGGGDMTLDNTSITAGQSVTVTGFGITAGQA